MFGKFIGWRPEYQEILNRLPAGDWPVRKPILVRARVDWAEGGEQWIAGRALRRDDRDGAIYIQIAVLGSSSTASGYGQAMSSGRVSLDRNLVDI